MVTIITAMYPEAAPFIEKLKLKKDMSFTKFQLFASDNIRLLITGTGILKAAIAVTAYLNTYSYDASDFFINVGICASDDNFSQVGKIHICDKIIYKDTGFTYYPDMLYPCPFESACLITVSKPMSEAGHPAVSDRLPFGNVSDNSGEYNFSLNTQSSSGSTVQHNECGYLYDMEAAGIYQALSSYVYLHQFAFIKIVSDILGEGKNVTPEQVKLLVGSHTDSIINFIHENFGNAAGNISEKTHSSTSAFENADKLLEDISLLMHLSVTMRHQLVQYFTYAKTLLLRMCEPTDKAYEIYFDIINMLYKELSAKPCQNKKEGKIRFERFKTEFFRLLFTYIH